MISASTKRDRIVFSHFYNNEYIIYQSNSERLLNIPVTDVKTINLSKGSLPPLQNLANDIVGPHFQNVDNPEKQDTFYAMDKKIQTGF